MTTLAPAAPAAPMPVAPAPEKTPADVLRHAALLLLERGWCQNVSEDSEGRFCVSGAINFVATGRPWPPLDGDESAVRVAARDAFMRHISGPSLPSWNDMPGRSTAQVVEALRAAAEEVA